MIKKNVSKKQGKVNKMGNGLGKHMSLGADHEIPINNIQPPFPQKSTIYSYIV